VVARGCTRRFVWGCVEFFSEAQPDRGFVNSTEEEGSRTIPSLQARILHAAPFLDESDEYGLVLTVVVHVVTPTAILI